MTDIICYEDSYITTFTTKVVSSNDNQIILDRTAFYPGGGGQPCDIGEIKSPQGILEVSKVNRIDGNVVHHVSDNNNLSKGDTVEGSINWDYRYGLMRTHTALHILCGVVWKHYNAHVTGSDIKPLKARMDFEFENMSSNFAEEVEILANKEIELGRPITIKTLPRKEAFAIPDLIRTKINLLPPAIQNIRIVDIEGLDIQADGGTHVNNTKEVGEIKIIGHESKGKINKRLRIAVK